MKKFKRYVMRWLAMFICLVMAFVISGCNDDDTGNSAEEVLTEEVVISEPCYDSQLMDWYNMLDKKEKVDYCSILLASEGQKVKSEIIHQSSYNFMSFVVKYDYPELELFKYEKNIVNGYYEITPKNYGIYCMQISKIDSVISELVDTVKKENSLIKKYRLIHDWIVENIEYDTKYKDIVLKKESYDSLYMKETNSANIYGAIVEKKAVCSGMSKAFKYICNKCDLDAMYVEGTVDNIGHAWNVVPINGEYFLIDCTFDITGKDGLIAYLAKADGNYMILRSLDKYSYFLINDLFFDGRQMMSFIPEDFFRRHSLDWEIVDENTIKTQNGLTITCSDHFKFLKLSPESKSDMGYILKEEELEKVINSDAYYIPSFSISDGEIENIVYLGPNNNLQAIQELKPEKKNIYNSMIETVMIICIRYNDELYTVSLYYYSM